MNYEDLTNKPAIPDLTGYATQSWVIEQLSRPIQIVSNAQNNIQDLLNVTLTDASPGQALVYRNGMWVNEDVSVDLTGYATETYVDTVVSNVSVDLTGYATEAHVANAVNTVIGTADIDYDTLGEIQSALEGFNEYTDTDTQDYLTRIVGHIIPDTDVTYDLGSATNRFRDLFLSGNTIHIGDASISADGSKVDLPADSRVNGAQIPPTNLEVQPEVLAINVNAEGMGQDIPWLFTWEASSIAYSRVKVVNEVQQSVPLYEAGVYELNNFAAGEMHTGLDQTHSIKLAWVEGAGFENTIDWAVDVGMVTMSNENINGGADTQVHRKTITVPSFDEIVIPEPADLTAPVTVEYDVTFDAGYLFSGAAKGTNVNIGPWYRGGTYTINMNAAGHPLYLTTDNGANFTPQGYFGEYTDGVTGSRTDVGTITITVPMDAPDTLFYQCGNHAGMRGGIRIQDLEVKHNAAGNVIVYLQHAQEGMMVPVELRPIPALGSQMCIVFDEETGLFVPQDLITYLERTPGFAEKIREIAGTATLVVADGAPVVSTVSVVDDASYLPYTGNNIGDLAYDKAGNRMYVWESAEWEATTVDLSSYAQTEYVDNAIAAAEITQLTIPYDMGFYIRGPVLLDEVVGAFVTTRDILFRSGAPGSIAKVTDLLSGRCVLNILIDAISVGTITFESGSYTGDISVSTTVPIAAGSIVTLKTDPDSQVVNENMVITLVGEGTVEIS